jgi:hypothetical protein
MWISEGQQIAEVTIPNYPQFTDRIQTGVDTGITMQAIDF